MLKENVPPEGISVPVMEKAAANKTIFLMGNLLVRIPLSRDRNTIISEGIILMVLYVTANASGSFPSCSANSVLTAFATGPTKLAR